MARSVNLFQFVETHVDELWRPSEGNHYTHVARYKNVNSYGLVDSLYLA